MAIQQLQLQNVDYTYTNGITLDTVKAALKLAIA